MLLNREEGLDVDFKKNSKLDQDDLVAFANASDGGAILLGVAEYTGSDGRQETEIAGCQLNDNIRLEITNRANSCSPPVDLEVIEENGSRKPFIRIEIPSGNSKPYCTSGGTYKIRGDGHNRALLPNEVLQILLANETETFVTRFREATDHVHEQLQQLTANLSQQFDSVFNDVQSIRENLEEATCQIFSETSDAASNAEDSTSGIYENQRHILENKEAIEFIRRDVEIASRKIDSLLVGQHIQDLSVPLLEKDLSRELLGTSVVTKKQQKRFIEWAQDAYPTVPPEKIELIVAQYATLQ
ncbi:AlbA family DNA-binding domain-containing protein [Mariniblastus fucicola]|uniref:Divergent AAA domain protein n=2 Tax=Mariniblastus fucicola TaxID=980251 RepID=A0A5B9P7Q2_9BACT|nr:ATP-binding protein [Mariniblastus fucicola]QEG22358.1 Divergent AAA domain protein [Mariniblastus fucicola]